MIVIRERVRRERERKGDLERENMGERVRRGMLNKGEREKAVAGFD